MTVDQMIKWLTIVAQLKRGDAEVLVWDRRSKIYVNIEQYTFGADGTAYLQGESLDWDGAAEKWTRS